MRDREELLDVVGRERRLARRLREGDARLGRRSESEGEDEAHHPIYGLWRLAALSMKFAALLALWLLSGVAPRKGLAPAAVPNRWAFEAAFKHLAWSAGA